MQATIETTFVKDNQNIFLLSILIMKHIDKCTRQMHVKSSSMIKPYKNALKGIFVNPTVVLNECKITWNYVYISFKLQISFYSVKNKPLSLNIDPWVNY